jgi:hypothetical protein
VDRGVDSPKAVRVGSALGVAAAASYSGRPRGYVDGREVLGAAGCAAMARP